MRARRGAYAVGEIEEEIDEEIEKQREIEIEIESCGAYAAHHQLGGVVSPMLCGSSD